MFNFWNHRFKFDTCPVVIQRLSIVCGWYFFRGLWDFYVPGETLFWQWHITKKSCELNCTSNSTCILCFSIRPKSSVFPVISYINALNQSMQVLTWTICVTSSYPKLGIINGQFTDLWSFVFLKFSSIVFISRMIQSYVLPKKEACDPWKILLKWTRGFLLRKGNFLLLLSCRWRKATLWRFS